MMLIGVPKEIKNHEYRVGLTPGSVRELVHHNHRVIIETAAGAGIGVTDDDYRAAGALVADSAAEIYGSAELIVKVKEPQDNEYRMLREGQVVFAYFHLAPAPALTRALMDAGIIAVAYETVTGPGHTLPLLAPMSEVAGRLAIQAGAHCLERDQGGKGILIGGVPGVAPARVLIIGGGVVGENAANVAVGMEADVTLLDRSLPRLRRLDTHYAGRVKCIYSTKEAVEKYALESDLVVGAVLIPGAAAPRLITRAIVEGMAKGSVIVDVAIDQGGCAETSHPTTHQEPTFVVDGVVHYCVSNMPGAVPRTSAFALNNATLPFTLALANLGYRRAMQQDPYLLNGLNIHMGKITYEAVARALDFDYVPAIEVISG
jgi:alanine dehydrogenase